MRTSTVKPSAPIWYVIDAKGQTLGDIASKVAHILRGKHKPTFSPHQLCGDEVVVVNARSLAVEQRKLLQKEYVTHTGYLGHLRSVRMRDMLKQKPEQVVEQAVFGMLPRNRLRARMLKRLHVFADADHTHSAQKPVPLPL